MAVTVILDLHFRPEDVDEILAGFKVDLVDTRAYEGNLSVLTLQDQDDPGHVTLVERWEHRSDQEKYIAWRSETGTLDKTAARLTAPLTITYFDELPEV